MNITRRQASPLRWLLVGIIIILCDYPQLLRAEDRFNSRTMAIEHSLDVPVDLPDSVQPAVQAPGVYRVDILVNSTFIDRWDVAFRSSQDGKLLPILTIAQWQELGVKTTHIPTLSDFPEGKTVDDPARLMPEVAMSVDLSHQRLAINLPQVLTDNAILGMIAPSLWDEGAPAALVNYSYNAAESWQTTGEHNQNDFLNLRSGLNWGGWRLRNYSTWNSIKYPAYHTSVQKWNSAYSYLQHDIPAIRGQFLTGESTSPADVFDSVQFRGVQLTSDDNMLPDSLRGYAPVIRGIANSNAIVTIRQNGAVIYQTHVTPGAFVINDLYPTSASGDIEVTVTESNGDKHRFTQPFSAVPVMQREGRLKYAFTGGRYRPWRQKSNEPEFAQGTLIYGLGSGITVFGGGQFSADYSALNAGLGTLVGDMGSVSLDTTWAKDSSSQGQAWRVQYAKNLASTDTTFSMGALRYSDNYFNFSDATDVQHIDASERYNALPCSQLRFSLTQNIDHSNLGSLSFSYYQQKYRGSQANQRNYSLDYNINLYGIDYSLAVASSENVDLQLDKQISLSVSVPLERWLPRARATFSSNSTQHGDTLQQVGLNGTLLEDNNLSYSVSEGYGNRGQGNSGSVNFNYLASAAQVSGGYNYNQQNHQINYGLQGAIVAHPYGVTFAQPLAGDMASIAIVRAPGAAGVKVQNNKGVYTDWRGYAVVRYVSPYKRTRVSLDTTSFDENTDVDNNVLSVVPTAGAVVIASFKTRSGGRLLLTLTHAGKPVPFGAQAVVVNDKTNSGIVGDNGQVYLSGLSDEVDIRVNWQTGQCVAHFKLPKSPTSQVLQAQARCQ